ncbi:hypothetical protein [Dyella sp.]|uniref:hypothetical protein n=1 Tax=Dyella sp. TaxID=1869338 RepID=UPI002D77F87E|nr:hypothetical protein [Dyella sp.]HET7330819.1 hypothetical protein [Dyella sp.]
MVFPWIEHTEHKRGYLRLLDIQSPGKTAAENKMAYGVGIPASQATFVTELPKKSDLANHHQVLGGEVSQNLKRTLK